MGKLIVLFDGECNLCTASIQFIVKRDPRAYFTFASLQSTTGRRLLEEHGMSPDRLDTIALVDGPRCFTKSDAALRVARHLSGLWPLLAVLSIIPRPLRDRAYDIVARNRYRWFGTPSTCLVPSRELLNRFLEER